MYSQDELINDLQFKQDGTVASPPEPVVTLTINGRMIWAECSDCLDALPLGKEVDLADQGPNLRAVFARHLALRHHDQSSTKGLQSRANNHEICAWKDEFDAT